MPEDYLPCPGESSNSSRLPHLLAASGLLVHFQVHLNHGRVRSGKSYTRSQLFFSCWPLMMDYRSNNKRKEKAIKNSSLLLIKSAAHRGPAATDSQRGLKAAQKKGTPAPQKRRLCHQVEWSWPRFVHPCIEVASVINLSGASGRVAASLFTKFTLRPLIL